LAIVARWLDAESVAARPFLSSRAAEWHLTRAFITLEITAREELGSALAEVDAF
jgi:hypothetical protein